MSLTQRIREFALDLGFSRIGIIPYQKFEDYWAEVASRGNHYAWLDDTMRLRLANNNPRNPDTFAQSVICLVVDFSRTSYPESLVGKVGRAYQSRCYLPPEHRTNGARTALFRSYLRECGCDCESDVCLPDRWIGAMSGATTYGKNTLAYSEEGGSFIILKTVVVDRELEYDSGGLETRCPEGCRRCLDACPTGALYQPFKMNPFRCISFNTFGRATPNGHIPVDIREKMGSVIHGCDICQQVCPQNQAGLRRTSPQDPFLEILAADFTLVKLLHLTDDFYQTRVNPIMYNYIRELWLFQRNAAVAIGNSGDDSLVPELIEELNHPQDAVRSHVAWALGKIGGAKAKRALENRKNLEASEVVRQELEWALGRFA